MAYTPPTYNDIDFEMEGGYTPPAYNAVNFAMGEGAAVILTPAEITITASMGGALHTVPIPTAEVTVSGSIGGVQAAMFAPLTPAEITITASMGGALHTVPIPTAEVTVSGSMSTALLGRFVDMLPAGITVTGSMGDILHKVGMPPAEVNVSASLGGFGITVAMPPANIIITGAVGGIAFTVPMPPAEVTVSGSMGDILRFDRTFADVYYLFTLTGAEDSLEDVEMPMSSFQTRMRDGDPSFLSVVIPDIEYASAVNARPNGTLQVDMAYKRDGVFLQRETIMRADMDAVRVDQGVTSSPITLSGHRTESYPGNAITLDTSLYRVIIDGKIRHRLAEPNISLRPGDTVTIGSDTFVADLITYFMSVDSQTMEVSEA